MSIACAALLAAFVCLLTPLSARAAVTVNPQSGTYPEYAVAYYTCDADDEGAEFHWYIIFEGTTYDFNDPDLIKKAPWVNYVDSGFGTSPDGKGLHFDGIHKELGGASVYCVVKAGDKEYTSSEAVISVSEAGSQMPPVVSVSAPAEITVGESAKLSCRADEQEGVTFSYQWYHSFSGRLQDIMAFLDEGSDNAEFTVAPESAGKYYYCCMVTASGSSGTAATYSGMLEVTVSEPASEMPTENPDGTAAETGGAQETADPAETGGSSKTAAPSETSSQQTPKDGAAGGVNIMSLLVILFAVLCVLVCVAVVVIIIILLTKKKK